MRPRRGVDVADVEVVVRGDVPADARAEAATKIAALAGSTGEPVLHARVRLTRSGDPAQPRPVAAQANLDVGGRLLRGQVAAASAREAIDLLQAKLRNRLPRLEQDWQAIRGRRPRPHEWRHGSEPAHRPAYFPRPPEEREVVRHKAFELSRASPDEAAFDMDQLDYDFHLFTDAATGGDAVVYRAGPTGYRLARLTPSPEEAPPAAVPMTESAQPAPRLGLPEAVERLGLTGLPFLFFADDATGRGRVLYRRYDGHYGLITPAE